MRFLVDSGALISIFPAPLSTSKSGVSLVTADSSLLSCSRSQIIPLWFGKHLFDWPFQLAPVAVPILGADFLSKHNNLLDVANQRVFSADSPWLLRPSTFQFLWVFLQPAPAKTFWPTQSVSLTFSRSFQTLCHRMDSQLLILVTELVITFLHSLVLQWLLNLVASIQRS